MKLAVRIFALSIAVAGITAAATTSKTAPVLPSHLSASASVPISMCGGHMTCAVNPSGN